MQINWRNSSTKKLQEYEKLFSYYVNPEDLPSPPPKQRNANEPRPEPYVPSFMLVDTPERPTQAKQKSTYTKRLYDELHPLKDHKADNFGKTPPKAKKCFVCHKEDKPDASTHKCSKCKRGYHSECYVPALKRDPPEDWNCIMCVNVEDLGDQPNEPNKEGGRLGKQDYLICSRLFLELHQIWPDVKTFLLMEALDFQMYRNVINHPVALDLIRKKLDRKSPLQYQSVKEFLKDVRLMFRNCKIFWKDQPVGENFIKHADTLKEHLDKCLQEFQPLLQLKLSKDESREKKSYTYDRPSSKRDKNRDEKYKREVGDQKPSEGRLRRIIKKHESDEEDSEDERDEITGRKKPGPKFSKQGRGVKAEADESEDEDDKSSKKKDRKAKKQLKKETEDSETESEEERSSKRKDKKKSNGKKKEDESDNEEEKTSKRKATRATKKSRAKKDESESESEEEEEKSAKRKTTRATMKSKAKKDESESESEEEEKSVKRKATKVRRKPKAKKDESESDEEEEKSAKKMDKEKSKSKKQKEDSESEEEIPIRRKSKRNAEKKKEETEAESEEDKSSKQKDKKKSKVKKPDTEEDTEEESSSKGKDKKSEVKNETKKEPKKEKDGSESEDENSEKRKSRKVKPEKKEPESEEEAPLKSSKRDRERSTSTSGRPRERSVSANEPKEKDLKELQKEAINVKAIEKAQEQVSGKATYECNYCNAVYGKLAKMEDHTLNHFEEKLASLLPVAKNCPTGFKCPTCDKIYAEHDLLMRHYAFDCTTVNETQECIRKNLEKKNPNEWEL